jgi:hypothetical protein
MAEFQVLHVAEMKELQVGLIAAELEKESRARWESLRVAEAEEEEEEEEEEEDSRDPNSFRALGIREPQRSGDLRDEETLRRDDGRAQEIHSGTASRVGPEGLREAMRPNSSMQSAALLDGWLVGPGRIADMLGERLGVDDGEPGQEIGDAGGRRLDRAISCLVGNTPNKVEPVPGQLKGQIPSINDGEDATRGESTKTRSDVGSNSRYTLDPDQDSQTGVESSTRDQEPESGAHVWKVPGRVGRFNQAIESNERLDFGTEAHNRETQGRGFGGGRAVGQESGRGSGYSHIRKGF